MEKTTSIMSMDEFCKTLDIGKNVAYHLLNSNQVKAFRLGRVWKIPRSSVEEFIRSKSAEVTEHIQTDYRPKSHSPAPFSIAK